MKTHDFINSHIGQEVYITGHRDLAMDGSLRPLIHDRTKMIVIKLTKNGMAYLQDSNTLKYYSVPPRNVRLYSELISENNNEE